MLKPAVHEASRLSATKVRQQSHRILSVYTSGRRQKLSWPKPLDELSNFLGTF
jgi:hypothetical protein